MRLLRSWPRRIPDGRSYVVDGVDRLVIDNCCYRPLGDVPDDVLLLEWDIAVSKEDLAVFSGRARAEPDRVRVAPYRIYYEHMLPEPVWAHRRWDGTGTGTINPVGATPIGTGEPTANLFGLGMVYLPRTVVAGFLTAGYSNHMGDVELSMWHYLHVAREVPVDWDVRPVHLNYQTPQL